MASGAWESITINGRRFTCKADDDVTVKFPGFSNEALPQGDGSIAWKKTRHQGSISGLNVNIDTARGDEKFLQDSQNSLTPFPVTGTKVDGTVISGEMQITDEIEFSSAENTAGLTLEGMIEIL